MARKDNAVPRSRPERRPIIYRCTLSQRARGNYKARAMIHVSDRSLRAIRATTSLDDPILPLHGVRVANPGWVILCSLQTWPAPLAPFGSCTACEMQNPVSFGACTACEMQNPASFGPARRASSKTRRVWGFARRASSKTRRVWGLARRASSKTRRLLGFTWRASPQCNLWRGRCFFATTKPKQKRDEE